MKKIIFLLLILTLLFNSESYAFVKTITKISVKVAEELGVLGKNSGSSAVANELFKLAKNVPPELKEKFFESSYLKILVAQNRLPASMEDEILKNLSGVPGFKSTLSKMVGKPGVNDAKAVGHGFEILAANEFKKKGYNILSIGERFNDGIKSAPTDIDLIISKGRTKYVFELKNYNPYDYNNNTLIQFRSKMESLEAYAKANDNVKPFFVISNKPADKKNVALLEAYAKYHNVKILYADSETLPMLLELSR